MKNLYIVTGANGHLGSTLVRMLQRRGAEVRGLLLPQAQAASHSRVMCGKRSLCAHCLRTPGIRA